jgi:hypothetical protein
MSSWVATVTSELEQLVGMNPWRLFCSEVTTAVSEILPFAAPRI